MNNTIKAATNYITSNKVVMDFLSNEAREQVASDIRTKTGSGTTAKGVEVLLMNGNDKTISERFEKYLMAGVASAVAMRIESIA